MDAKITPAITVSVPSFATSHTHSQCVPLCILGAIASKSTDMVYCYWDLYIVVYYNI